MPNVADQLITSILDREGRKYTNNPADRGGPTWGGVTQATARKYGYTGDMRFFTEVQARAIYLSEYFNKPGYSLVAITAPRLAEYLLDYGVNSGPIRASTDLQKAMNVFNQGATLWPELVEDGSIGGATFTALKLALAKRGREIEDILTEAVDDRRGVMLQDLARAAPTQEGFMLGWYRRKLELRQRKT